MATRARRRCAASARCARPCRSRTGLRARDRRRRATRRNGPDFIAGPSEICRTPDRRALGPREAQLLGARRHLRLPPARRHRRRSRRRHARTGRRQGRARSATGMTLPLGGLRLQDMSGELAQEGGEDRRAARCATCRSCKAGKGRAFYAVGGTWRALARLHMAQTRLSAPRDARLRDAGARGAAISARLVAARRHPETLSTASRSCRPPAGRCWPMARWCSSIIVGDQSRRRSSSRRSACARACSTRCSTPDEQRARSADRRRRAELNAAALALAAPCARSWSTGPTRFMPSSGIDETAEEKRAAPRGLPARRHRLARASGLSRRAVAQHHRPRGLHRRRPSRPRLSRAVGVLPPRRPDDDEERRASANSRRPACSTARASSARRCASPIWSPRRSPAFCRARRSRSCGTAWCCDSRRVRAAGRRPRDRRGCGIWLG